VAVKHRMVLLQSVHVLLADAEPGALHVSLVDKQRAAVETGLVGAYHCLAWVTDLEINLLVHLVADIVLTFLDEDDLVNVVQLRENKEVLLDLDWIQMLQELNHKVLILDIGPGVETVFILATQVGDAEVLSKVLQEPKEHEVFVDVALDLARQLLEQGDVLWLRDGLVMVILPSVIKVLLNAFLHPDVDVLALVKLLDQAKKFGEVVSIVEASVDRIKLV
jgi:hypothetical protein